MQKRLLIMLILPLIVSCGSLEKSSGDACLTFGQVLPIKGRDYTRDGLREGTQTEKNILKLDEIYDEFCK